MTFFGDLAGISRGWIQLRRPAVLLCRTEWKRGAHDAAAVLERLIHWSEHAEWIFKTDADWEAEAFVTKNQAHHILKRMAELGWVETKQAPRPHAERRNRVTWYRLDVEIIEAAYLALVAPEVDRVTAIEPPEVDRVTAIESDELIASPRSTSSRHRDQVGVAPYIGNRDLGTEPAETETAPKRNRRAISADELRKWEPDEQLWAWSQKTNPRIGKQDVEQFKDHHVSAGTKVLDVSARWRTWVRNSLQYGAIGNGRAANVRARWQERMPVHEAIDVFIEVAEAEEAANAQRALGRGNDTA